MYQPGPPCENSQLGVNRHRRGLRDRGEGALERARAVDNARQAVREDGKRDANPRQKKYWGNGKLNPVRDIGNAGSLDHKWAEEVSANGLTTCTSAAGTARAHDLLTGGARAPARDGPVSSKCGLGGTSSGRPAPTLRRPVLGWPARAGQPWYRSTASLP